MGGTADGSGSGHGELTSSEEIEFVNREIDRQLELWRHADDAVLGPAGPFIGLSATLIPAAVLLSDVVEETRRFYLACIPVGLFLACLAVLLAARVMGLFGAAAGFAVWWMAEDASPWLLVVAGSLATLVALGVELAFMAQRRRTVAREIAAELGIVPTL